MGEVREENERLKTLLARVVKDYQSLKTHFDIVQQDQPKKLSDCGNTQQVPLHVVDESESDQFISLSLGRSPSIIHRKDEEKKAIHTSTRSKRKDIINTNPMEEEGLTLGLDCKFEGSSHEPASNNISPSNSVEEVKEEEEPGEPWPPSKMLKNARNGPDIDEVAQQAHVKKTRVSVRARCDAPTMHDGCQWRKYGQKIAKGNPCPRAYYRCTVAPACPVRKQVQRCAEDMSILITTYEGTHNHPLPISATAMASTTSAAASMLISGSSTSHSPFISSPPSSSSSLISLPVSSTTATLHGLNFNLSDTNHRVSLPFYLPNPTNYSTPSYPTITLDLTSPPQPPPLSRLTPPSTRYSTSFNFSNSRDTNTSTTSLPTSWSSTPSSYMSYYNKNPIPYQSYLHKATTNPSPTQHVLTDTIAKAITSDPSFQSSLAAAITSYVGGGGSAPEASTGVNGCGSSFLTRAGSRSAGPTAANGQQQGSMMFLQAPLGMSAGSKSASASPGDNREGNIN